MKQAYTSFEEIETDLKRLKLERQIGMEELRGIKGEFSDNLKAKNWLGTAAGYAWKFGVFLLLKKIFK